MKIGIYGASDDGVVLEIDGKTVEEYDTYEPGPVMWRADLRAPDGDIMRVHALYDGCWSIAIGQAEEDTPLPDWDIQILQKSGYSTMAQIEAPAGTELVNVWPTRSGDDA